MVLIIAVGVAAAAYSGANNKGGVGDDDDGSPPSPPPDLKGKTRIDLLPLERTLALFESPIASVTFMDGDPASAAEYLRRRVADIAYRNPWLGGWIATDRAAGGRGNAVRLYYDETSDDLAPDLFISFEPGQVNLSRDTPYSEYGRAFKGHNVVVNGNAGLIDRSDRSLWRVSLIPDAKRPNDRFAVAVSMSHMIGDGHTFHKVYTMLRSDSSPGEIECLNPRRKMAFVDQATERMGGTNEAFYVDRISRSPLWARFASKPDKRVMETKVFYVEEHWIEGEKRKWTEAAAKEKTGRGEPLPSADDKTIKDEGDGNKGDNGSIPTVCGKHQSSTSKFAASFAPSQDPTAKSTLSTNDVVSSWFFRTTSATVGLVVHNLRNRLGGGSKACNDTDAGNYAMAVPHTPRDYETPCLMQRSRETSRRAHGDDAVSPTGLPSHAQDNKYAIAVDWRSFQRKGGLVLGDRQSDKSTQVLHLPLFLSHDLDLVPKSFSFLNLFNAGPNGEPAVVILAPQQIMEKVERSGIVREVIDQREGTEEDAFREAVVGAAEGHRKSVYASLLDETDLSTLVEVEGQES